MSSGNLDKYKYLTGEDLDYQPSTVEQAKLEYSPLGKFFNKGLEEHFWRDWKILKIKTSSS